MRAPRQRIRHASLTVLLLVLGALLGASPGGGLADSTGGAPGTPALLRGTLAATFDTPTSLAFGPDGRLYVASVSNIDALTIDPITKQVLDIEPIAADLNFVLGIAFDPTTPSPVTVYAAHQNEAATDGFEGAISKFSAPDWERQDVITGLPTSAPLLNHLTNGIAFDEDGRLFIAQGSTTDAGITDPPGAQTYFPEGALSAAILVADIHAPGFDGAITYSPAGPPLDDNVNQTGGDVVVLASGLRNPYDLVLHSNGRLYATDNAPLGLTYSLSCTVSGSPAASPTSST
jgi:glucose/arabinose dehydrogenase